MKTEYKYLIFEEYISLGERKTKISHVKNTSGSGLGVIKWYGSWRKYCFYTLRMETVFDTSCLADIQDFLNQLMQERKGEKEG